MLQCLIHYKMFLVVIWVVYYFFLLYLEKLCGQQQSYLCLVSFMFSLEVGKRIAKSLVRNPSRLSPKCSTNPNTVTPLWKKQFENGQHPIRGLYRVSFKIFFSNFRSHIKDSKWDRKYIFMNYASCNGSPQQILLWQLPFANEAKPSLPLQSIVGSVFYQKIFRVT